LKDIKFLYNRFYYLKVGSRKFLRMIMEMKECYKDKPEKNDNVHKTIKLTRKPKYSAALETYLAREKIYTKMRVRRKQGM